MESVARRFFFVVNGNAGHGRARKIWEQLLPMLKAADIEFAWKYTPGANSASQMTREALDSGYNYIMAMGGDGTLHEVVNGYLHNDAPYKEDTAVGFWPLGTGCDTARLVFESREAEHLVNMLADGRIERFDVGKCAYTDKEGKVSQRYFINSADAGIGADVACYTNTHSKAMGGKLSFLWAAIVCLIKYDYCQMKVWTDDKLSRGKYLMVAICNGQYFGGGMRVVPAAQFTDGKLDVMRADKAPLFTIFSLLGKIYKGGHVGHRIAHFDQCRHVRVESERPMLIELDGESVGYTAIDICNVPAVINMLVPADSSVK